MILLRYDDSLNILVEQDVNDVFHKFISSTVKNCQSDYCDFQSNISTPSLNKRVVKYLCFCGVVLFLPKFHCQKFAFFQ